MKYNQAVHIQIPKYIFVIVNNLFEIQKNISMHGDAGNLNRNVSKIKESLEEFGITYEDPQGEFFNETRTDLDATISGQCVENLYVVDVIKPIIRASMSGISQVIQKGIVVVESKNEGNK